MIQIASGYGPSDHCSHILEDPPSGDWRIHELGIDYSGYVSAMKLA
jgi:hypothetical protein